MMRNDLIQLTYRSGAKADPELPLGVRSAGLYAVSPSWSEVPRKKDFLQLFHVIRGTLEFRVAGEFLGAGPGELFQYYPGEVHDIRVAGSRCLYFWITLDHPVAMRWMQDMGFSDRKQDVGPYREGLYEGLSSALKQCTPEGDRVASREVFQMLLNYQARGRTSQPGSLAGRARSLMNNGFRNPGMGITAVARQLDVHRTTLMRAFKGEYGLSPCCYLQNLRVQFALARLKETVLPVQVVAADSGFTDGNYFARLIRQKTGLSPLEFRRS